MGVVLVVQPLALTMAAVRLRTTTTSTEAASVLQRHVQTMAAELPQHITILTATASVQVIVQVTIGNKMKEGSKSYKNGGKDNY